MFCGGGRLLRSWEQPFPDRRGPETPSPRPVALQTGCSLETAGWVVGPQDEMSEEKIPTPCPQKFGLPRPDDKEAPRETWRRTQCAAGQAPAACVLARRLPLPRRVLVTGQGPESTTGLLCGSARAPGACVCLRGTDMKFPRTVLSLLTAQETSLPPLCHSPASHAGPAARLWPVVTTPLGPARRFSSQ